MKQSEWLDGHKNLLVAVWVQAVRDLEAKDTLEAVDALGFVLRAAEWFEMLGVEIRQECLLKKAVNGEYTESSTGDYLRP